MLQAALRCLDGQTVESKEERAYNAALAIQNIYSQETKLTNGAKRALYINVDGPKKKKIKSLNNLT